MKLLSILFYYLGDIASHTIARWSWGGWVYQRLMRLSVDCDKDFNVWKEVKPGKKTSKNSHLFLDIHATKVRGKIIVEKVNIRRFDARKKRRKRK